MKISRKINPGYRSLLQKAVRRGHVDLVVTLSSLIGSLGAMEKRWFGQQVAVMAFRMCWPLALELKITRPFHSKVAAMIKTARSVKNQDAAGLGAMAYAASKGELVPEQLSQDRAIRIVSSSIQRPDDFWAWFDAESQTRPSPRLWSPGRGATLFDRAIIQAAAYLAVTTEPPELSTSDSIDDRFPYWIAFDHHTREGRRGLADISRDLNIPLAQLRWILFYFEGARTQKRITSVWWDRYCRWQFEKVGCIPEQAHLIWQTARPQLIAALTEEARRLHRDIYRWKRAHLEEVNQLKTQAVQFLSAHQKFNIQQKPLF